MRDSLVALLKETYKNAANKMITYYEDEIKDNAEYLLANRVIVLPCEIGDEIWYIDKNYTIQKAQISSAIIQSSSMHLMAMRYDEETEEIIKLAIRFEDLNIDYWTTKEEAEQALEKRKGTK